MITLTEDQVKRLETILAELPMKYGVPILNLINEKPDNITDSANNDSVQSEG
jgi:hypothetical protein